MSLRSDDALSLSVSQAVLAIESNDGRFEAFCNAVVAKLEGDARILSTSKSWDLGRDGVGFGRADGIYVLTSLRDDPDIKMLNDIERIGATTKGIRVAYFCSTQPISEHARDQIQNTLRVQCDNAFDIRAMGSAQLCEIALAHPGLIEQYYGAEVSNTLRTIRSDPDDETEQNGLRLALIASSGEDSVAIRKGVYSSILLDVLSDGGGRTLTRCVQDVSHALHLHHNLSEASVEPHLEDLRSAGSVSLERGIYAITEEGRAQIAAREVDAASRLIAGRAEIRIAIEASIGSRLTESHFNSIWTIFEERIASHFMRRGGAIVEEVSDLLNGVQEHVDAEDASPAYTFLDELANSVAATSSHADQQEELRQAVKDLFFDRTSAATDWLVRLSASYMAACALGLEYSSGVAIERLLARTTLVLDTDVLLSLLGEGEPDHVAVRTIVERWTQMRGRVLVAEPVLEEGAHHACIAQRDYDQVRHLMPGTPEDRLHLIENAFVRSFAELLSQKRVKWSHWPAYIDQYRGANASDWSNLFSYLATEYAIEKLPARSLREEKLEQDVRSYLLERAEAKNEGAPSKIQRDKATRDAQLYTALVHYVGVLKRSDPGATSIVVSSARRLAGAEAKFHESGEPHLVVSISTVLHLVSLLPNVSLGMSAMKAFLFDDRRGRFSSELERVMLRMVRTSQEVDLPFARRGTLMKKVRERLVRDAEARGEKGPDRRISVLERNALSDSNQERMIQILSESLDAVAVDTRTAKENRELRAKVADLERRLSERRPRSSK